MSQNNIEEMLHIAKSTKKYGEFNKKTERFIQGSKGLGILSVFKFGQKVTFKTIRNNEQLEFSLDFSQLRKLDNISEYSVDINRKESVNVESGTEIIIEGNEEVFTELKKYLIEEVNRDKILNSFLDPAFVITLYLNNRKFTTKSIDLLSYFPEKRVLSIQYNSEEEKIIFNGENGFESNDIEYPFDINTNLKIELDLIAFKFPGGRGQSADKLFFSTKDTNNLTPLIYINNNFFNNYEIFDPNIMLTIKRSSVLSQLIGYVKIYSNDSNMQFNSDRTNFQENKLTTFIINFLKGINIFIQKEGQKLNSKNHNNIKDTKIKPPSNLDTKEQQVTEQLKIDTECPSNNLKNNDTTKKENIIPIDNKINEQPKKLENPIDYNSLNQNNDTIPNVNEYPSLEINSPIAIIAPKECLIPQITDSKYKLNLGDTNLAKLCEQINKLSTLKKDYREVIACSFRSIFEISMSELKRQNRINFLKPPNARYELECGVVQFVEYVNTNVPLITKICNATGIKFHNFKNELSTSDFKNTIKLCHLGAHNSTSSLTDENLRTIGMHLSRFLPIVSVILDDNSPQPIQLAGGTI
jgi:hypothetical protein